MKGQVSVWWEHFDAYKQQKDYSFIQTVTVRLGTHISEEYAHDMYRVLGLIQRKIITGISIHNGGIGNIHISYTFLDPFF